MLAHIIEPAQKCGQTSTHYLYPPGKALGGAKEGEGKILLQDPVLELDWHHEARMKRLTGQASWLGVLE